MDDNVKLAAVVAVIWLIEGILIWFAGPSPLRFSLRTMFIITTIVAICMGMLVASTD